MEYRIFAEYRCAVIRLEGIVTADDMIAALKTIFSDPDIQTDYSRLWDMTRVASFSMDLSILTRWKETTRAIRHIGGGGRAAFVIPIDDFGLFTLGVKYINARAQSTTRRFYTIPEAAGWLGVPETITLWD